MIDRLQTLFRIARAIGQEEAVEVQAVEIIVPRHTNHFDATLDKAADDVGLHTAVNQNHTMLLVTNGLIGDDFLAAYLLHPVHRTVVLGGGCSSVCCD